MLKIQPDATFKTKVGISVAGQDRPVEIEVEYAYKTPREVQDYITSLPGRSDLDALTEIIRDWNGLDEPYSSAALDALLKARFCAARELSSAYFREVMGAKEKK